MSNSIPAETGPAYKAVAVTPHNTNDLAAPCRLLYVGGAGDVEVIMEGDTGRGRLLRRRGRHDPADPRVARACRQHHGDADPRALLRRP